MGKVCVIGSGNGDVAQCMASSLSLSGFHVLFAHVSELANKISKMNIVLPSCPVEDAVQDVEILVLMELDSDQIDGVIFGGKQDASVLPHGTSIILCSTTSPSYMKALEARLAGENKGLLLVDAFITDSLNGASGKSSVVVASGTVEALERTNPVLTGMGERFYSIEGGIGACNKVKMVNQVLAGVHLVAAAEAIVLGAASKLNTQVIFDIISNAAGSSRIFVSRVPKMLNNDMAPGSYSTLQTIERDLGIVLQEAKKLSFPLPLTAMAHQQILFGCKLGLGCEADAAVVKVWEKTASISVVSTSADSLCDYSAQNSINSAGDVMRIGFLGLGAMGFRMATTLLQKNFSVCGYDVYEPSLLRFKNAGGNIARSPREAAKDAQILILMVTNEDQAEDCLFGKDGAVSGLPSGSSIILCSTVSPGYVQRLERKVQGENKDVELIDAPVSGGVVRAGNGTLTIMSSGSKRGLNRAWLVLSAMSEKLYVFDTGAGAGSSVKMVNQLLAGVHIAAAAEAMAFGAFLGLNTRILFEILSHASGSSWMFMNRVPHMLDGDYTPYSALAIFVKDLGIVLTEAKKLYLPLCVTASSLQQFLLGAASGWAREDDAAVVKIFEKLTGITVAAPKETIKVDTHTQSRSLRVTEYPVLEKDEILSSLPPEWPEDPTVEIHQYQARGLAKVLVVLDDDPTGTQTVHGVTVLTEWTVESIKEEFEKNPYCLFILTNSRALSGDKASTLIKEICNNVKTAASMNGSNFTIVLRGDSTLRGHFPEEPDAAVAVLGEMDAWIVCPFFFQGGRYTIYDVHYVAEENRLVPAGNTEFAKDASFGFKSSSLKEWVEEKINGRVEAKNIASVSLETLRRGGPAVVCEQLCALSKGSICVVNAVSIRDIEVFAAGMIRAEEKGKRFLCRTAASFVSARIGIKPMLPLTPKSLGVFSGSSGRNGGLVVVGSYVPKTSEQVEKLISRRGHFLHCMTIDVPTIASGSATVIRSLIANTVQVCDVLIDSGKDILVMTSRGLVTGKDSFESLEINSRVSSTLVEIVKSIHVRPRYILAKGGITSSDLATKSMGARKAIVLGQAMPGVPLWELSTSSRHPGIPYIVFPGNVGGPNALADLVDQWSCSRPSTRDLLHAAERGGYAVGAFNVYNMEGVIAVVAAAEAEKSPAILQIHPSVLKHGQEALVACCITAAKNAKVPITVHLDHGDKEKDLVCGMDLGFDSLMVDGSHLPFDENVLFTKHIAASAHEKKLSVEAELGRLAGTEDGLTVEEYESKLTDVTQAAKFLEETKVDALAVCIGNVHGKYPPSGPNLRLDILKELQEVAARKNVFLVLHGASGLPEDLIKDCIKLGIRKFNVNTEVRGAYMKVIEAARGGDILDVMSSAKVAMQTVVAKKLQLFGSSGKAPNL